MSGVYIKGLEMPTGKEGVAVIIYPDGEAVVEPFDIGFSKYCEAIPVPDHGRLIEEDAAYDKIADEAGEEAGNYVDMDVVGRGLEYTPTIIPADKEED